jgi:hypothetical protein
MASFMVKGHNIEMWKETLQAKLDNTVQAVILLLPGSRGRCPLYDEIKKFLLEEIPVVSQVVLVGTIRAGKNIRSIVSKVLIQICAKIGGVPWTISDLPLLDRPSMVCGLDVYSSTHLGRKSVLGFCSSFNSSATKFYSKSIIQEPGVEAATHLQSLMEKAIKKFQRMTKFYPERIFFYRNGLSSSDYLSLTEQEVAMIKSALISTGLSTKVSLSYINVCARVNTRLFAQGEFENTFKNPVPGMVVN